MFCNVLLLHDNIRHTRTLPLLTDQQGSHESNLCYNLGSFVEAVAKTHEYAKDERA
jgi:hypothetical protein